MQTKRIGKYLLRERTQTNTDDWEIRLSFCLFVCLFAFFSNLAQFSPDNVE